MCVKFRFWTLCILYPRFAWGPSSFSRTILLLPAKHTAYHVRQFRSCTLVHPRSPLCVGSVQIFEKKGASGCETV
jgi:hypothetical protein